METDISIKFVAGIVIPIIALAIGMWWRVEHLQNKRIDDLSKNNGKEHGVLFKKVDKLHDKVEDIWKHLVGRDR